MSGKTDGPVTDGREDVRSGGQWVAGAALFELASMGFLPPTREFAAALSSGEYADACDEAARVAGLDGIDASGLRCYRGVDAEEAFHELRRERTRLFVGERKPLITPYVGVWDAQRRGQRGQLMVGAESMAIERFMRRCGVAKDLSAGQANDPIDHMGSVCEFMQYLCLVAARAVAVPEGAAATQADALLFHARHFTPYAQWCESRLREEARTPFYRFLPSLVGCLARW